MAFSSTKKGIVFNAPLGLSAKKYSNILDSGKYEEKIVKYNAALNGGTESTKEFMKANKKAKDGFVNYVKSVGDGTKTFDGYINYVNQANKAERKKTVKQKALSLGGNVLSGFLNIGTGMLAGVAINGILTLIDKIVHHSDNLIQKGEEAKSEIEQISQEYTSHKQAVDSVVDSYDTLRSKVNQKTNQNMGLTTNQYQEFLDMNNQLADMFPTLVSGYDSQGNAIVNLGNSASEAKTKLNELLEIEQGSNARKISEKAQDHYEGVAEQVRKIQKDISKQQEIYDSASKEAAKLSTDLYKGLENGSVQIVDNKANRPVINAIRDTLEKHDIVPNQENIVDENGNASVLLSFPELDKKTAKEVRTKAAIEAEELVSSYQESANNSIKAIELDKQEIKAKWAELMPTVNAMMQSSSAYQGLSDTLQNGISGMLANVDYSTIASKYDGDIEKFVYQGLIRPVASSSKDVQKAYEQLFELELNSDDMSMQEWADKRNKLIDIITDGDKDASKELMQNLGFLDENGRGKVKQQLDIMQEAIDGTKKTRDELKQLTREDFEIAYDIIINDDEDAIKTFEDLVDAIAAKKKELEADAYSLDAMSSTLASAVTAQGNLNTAMQNSVSSTGLLSEDVSNLATAFSEVDGYNTDELLEKTASGLRLNRDALAAYQAEQEKVTKQKFEKALELQNKALAEQLDLLNDTTLSNDKRNEAKGKIDSIQSEISELKLLQSQYNGLTSDYAKWMNALSNGEEGDIYDNVATNWQNVKKLAKEGYIGTEEFKRGVDYKYSGSLDNQTPQEVKAVYDTLGGLVSRWYQTNENGELLPVESLEAFISDASTLSDTLGRDVNTSLERMADGTKKATLDASEFAEAWGVSEEVITDIAGKFRDRGWDVDVTGVSSGFKVVASTAEDAAKKVHNLFDDNYDYDFNTSDAKKAQEQLSHLSENMGRFKNEDGTYNYDLNGAQEMMTMYEATARRAQEIEKSSSSIGQISADNTTEATKESVQAIQDYVDAKNELDIQTQKSWAGDSSGLTQAQEEATKKFEQLRNLQKEGKLPFDLDLTDLQTAEDDILGLSDEEIRLKLGLNTEESQKQIQQEAETVQKSLQESSEAAGNTELADALDFDIDTMSIDELTSKVQELNELKGSPDISPENAEQLETVIDGCESKIDELNGKTAAPQFVTDSVQQGADLINQFNSQFAQLNTLNATPNVDPSQIEQAQSDLMNTATEISQLSPEIRAQFGIEGETPEEIAGELAAKQYEMPVTVKLDEGQLVTLIEGITGKKYEIPVEADTDNFQDGVKQVVEDTTANSQIKIEPDTTEMKNAISEAQGDLIQGSGTLINADLSNASGISDLNSYLSSLEQGTTATVTVDVEGESDVENLISSMQNTPDATPVTFQCTVENQEQLDALAQEAETLNAQGKQITLEASVDKVDTSSIESGGEDISVPVTVKLDESQFSSLTQSLSGEPIEIPSKVEDPEMPNLETQDSISIPSEVEPPETPEVQGETVEYPSTVEQPDPPSVEGEVVEYPSKVDQPETPIVDGETVEYNSEVQPPEVPSIPDGGTIEYNSDVKEPIPPSPPDGGTVQYDSEVIPPNAPTVTGTVNYTKGTVASANGTVSTGTINYNKGNVESADGTVSTGIINYDLGSVASADGTVSTGVINYALGSVAKPNGATATGVINYTLGRVARPAASGTMLSPARADGTAYNVLNYKNAYSSGKVSLPKDETALVNELGKFLPLFIFEIENLSNAGNPLEPYIPQHSHEIRAGVMV